MPQVPTQLKDRKFGDYQIIAPLAESPTAWVVTAQHQTGLSVALKILKPAADALAVLRLYQQARQTFRLADVGLVPTIEVGDVAGVHFLAQEPMAGKDLWKRSTRVHGYDLGVAVHTVVRLACTLDTLHAARLVHRAITPDHILFDHDDEPRLLGLGYGYDQVKEQHFRNCPLRNDWALAPETRDCNTAATVPADVYSLGAILLFMLSGTRVAGDVDDLVVRRGLERVTLSEPARGIAALTGLLRQCLSRRTRDRPQSAWRFAEQVCLAAGREITSIWTTPPLADSSQQMSLAGERWFVMKSHQGQQSQLFRGDWAQVARSLLQGRLTGRELASQSLDKAFRPLSEFVEFARLVPMPVAT